MNAATTIIGDWVRAADSNIDDVGCVVGIRSSDYLIVEWDNGVTTTHRRESLENVPCNPQRPLELRTLD